MAKIIIFIVAILAIFTYKLDTLLGQNKIVTQYKMMNSVVYRCESCDLT